MYMLYWLWVLYNEKIKLYYMRHYKIIITKITKTKIRKRKSIILEAVFDFRILLTVRFFFLSF